MNGLMKRGTQVLPLLFMMLAVFGMNVEAKAAISGDIKGQIIDATTKESIGFVDVRVSPKGITQALKITTTDIEGQFLLSGVPAGTYDLIVSLIGYQTLTREVRLTSSSQVIDMKQLTLEIDEEMLDAVQVRGQRSQLTFEIDKKVFNVGADLSSTGESANEVLSNIPSVEVDNEGEVSLRGSSNVTIWINGRESGLTADNRAQILEQLPAETIDRIEVITNPSAKFSPEGTAGIINIILKEDRRPGYFGSVQVGATTQNSGQAGASINYSSPKWDINGSMGYRRHAQDGGSLSRINYTNDGTFLNTDSERSGRGNGLFARAGATYHITKKDEISLSSFGMFGKQKNNSDIYYDHTDYTSDRHSRGTGEMKGGNVELGYKHSWNTDHYLDFTASYNRWFMDGENEFSQEYSRPTTRPSIYQLQESKMRATNYDIQLDYSNKLSDIYKIEGGYRGQLSHDKNPVETFDGTSPATAVPQYSLFNHFFFDQDVHAVYSTFSGMMGRIGYQVGMRGEYTKRYTQSNTTDAGGMQQTGELRKKEFFDLFPSAFLTYNINDKNELQLNYSRRISRPRGGNLNDFQNITDSTNISMGNPLLLPEYGNSFEFNYIRSWETGHSLSVGLYGKTETDVRQRVTYLGTNNVRYSTTMNVGSTTEFGLELVGKIRVAKWLDLTPSFELYQFHLDEFTYAGVTYQARNQANWNTRLITNVSLAGGWNLQARGNYRASQTTIQGSRKANYGLDAGLRKNLFNRALALSVTARDLLNSRNSKNTISGQGFEQYSESWGAGRTFGVTATWNFGNMMPKKGRKPQGSDDGGGDGGGGFGDSGDIGY